MVCDTFPEYSRGVRPNSIHFGQPSPIQLTPPQLFVSNNPETINAPGNVTLFRDSRSLTGSHDIRVFAWHANETGNTRWWHLSVFAQAGGKASNIRYSQNVVENTHPVFRPLGRCLAKSQVTLFQYDTLLAGDQ